MRSSVRPRTISTDVQEGEVELMRCGLLQRRRDRLLARRVERSRLCMSCSTVRAINL
jgi:hypothetical protein